MAISEILGEAFGRLPAIVRNAVHDLTPEQLASPPAPGANSIGWLIWHLTRVQDDHMAELIDEPQIWETGDWGPRFGLPSDPSNTGYSHDPDEAAAVHPESPDALVAYYDAVAARTNAYIAGITADDLDQVVDDAWDPPVTLGARLVSVISDDLQHAGQASYVRGLLEWRTSM